MAPTPDASDDLAIGKYGSASKNGARNLAAQPPTIEEMRHIPGVAVKCLGADDSFTLKVDKGDVGIASGE